MRRFYSTNILKHTAPKDEIQREEKRGQCPPIIVERPSEFPQIVISTQFLESSQYHTETAQKWLVLPGKNGRQHKFPLQTILPKVQMMRTVPPKQLPRDVEVDRRRRQYSKLNLLQMLKEAGVTNEDLMPTEELYYALSENAFKHFLPLSFFDNSNYDSNSPEAWLALGKVEEGDYPLPAKVYLPNSQSLKDYAWQFAAVTAYNYQTHKWTVLALNDECVYQVPSVQIMFLADNPRNFVQRLKKAVEERNNAERQIQMESIVDCVLLQDLEDDRFMSNKRIDRLLEKIIGRASENVQRQIRTEVYLVFERLMACYEFEKFVKLMPKEFPTFGGSLISNSLPRFFKSLENIKEANSVKHYKVDIKELRCWLLHATIFYIGAGIEAMSNVAQQCQYIETLSIFLTGFVKPVPLVDFLQIQQSNSKNVATYLKNFWPQKISAGITLVLRALGKGWLDISLSNWSVYQMCKISRFILQTRFRMQESMQVLLEKSLINFSTYLTDPCLQLLDLKPDYKWTSNYIETEFPYAQPIFYLAISISEEKKVVYSTAPEDFSPQLTELFKKALEKTSGVRCIEAETLLNLKFAPNLYIETVELIEDLFILWNELLGRCYVQAAIPLNSYARLYERFIDFYLLHVTDFMKAYESVKHSSSEVKQDILEHKRQKQELREILPSNITIGPCQINVDIMKQLMIRKHIEIIKKLFEYYIRRMWDINEQLLDQCLEIYQKISGRPQSIEHLYEIRDFAATVPDVVEQLRANIQIMWLEYEMLDSFFYNLSDTHFNMKWQVYAWPHNIMQRLSTLREEQKNDIEEFRRVHSSECINFEERLESLNEEIQAFSLIFDPNKVTETAVEVKKTWKQIQEMEKLGKTLQYRQTLFDLEELSLEFLDSIITGFTPYRQLWLTCLDFLKLEEATIGNPLINLDLVEVWNSIEDIRKSLWQTHEIFSEKPEIQEVAQFYLAKCDEFVPVWQCIKWLKNENWLYMHWQELSNRGGMDIKYSTAMNFAYLMRKGIMANLNLVNEISSKVEQEADEYRRQMEEEERRREQELQELLMRKALRKCRRDILLNETVTDKAVAQNPK
ncbi:dynein heavy chain 1, axonemal [Rhagoletis pomonella]|uniref:dynein heavy chain 1, axonemal n=1 Tax=Rhagoletis pomonella TaxID=28610 RepID=UPI001783D978|nr:dynein heavy chain 1, axonemal [Rhagoletis pomonella]